MACWAPPTGWWHLPQGIDSDHLFMDCAHAEKLLLPSMGLFAQNPLHLHIDAFIISFMMQNVPLWTAQCTMLGPQLSTLELLEPCVRDGQAFLQGTPYALNFSLQSLCPKIRINCHQAHCSENTVQVTSERSDVQEVVPHESQYVTPACNVGTPCSRKDLLSCGNAAAYSMITPRCSGAMPSSSSDTLGSKMAMPSCSAAGDTPNCRTQSAARDCYSNYANSALPGHVKTLGRSDLDSAGGFLTVPSSSGSSSGYSSQPQSGGFVDIAGKSPSSESEEEGQCPLCFQTYPIHVLPQHA